MVKEYPQLTNDEVTRTDIYALKLAISIILNRLVATADDPGAIIDELAEGVEVMSEQLPYGDVPEGRREVFREAVKEKAPIITRLSQQITRHVMPSRPQ